MRLVVDVTPNFYKNVWSNKTKQAIQLGYANRIIYSNILLFDLKKRTRYIWEIEQDPSIHKHTSKTIR